MNPPDFTPVAELGEFGLIERLKTIAGQSNHPEVLLGWGDDAAVYRVGDGRVHVITSDALIEGVHFDRVFTPLRYLGFKAVSVNVSDVAAMNASPKYATVSIGIPHNLSVEMTEEIYRGMKQACTLYGMDIIGGDTMASRQLVLSVTVVGEADEKDLTYRSGAKPGDLMCVTGDVGAAYAGLKLLLDHKRLFEEPESGGEQPDLKLYEYLVERHLAPTARMDIIRDWKARGVVPHAVIDVSDGVASEIHHLCRQSGCGALLHAVALPIELQTKAAAEHLREDFDTFALYGGEDYELLFSISEEQAEKLDRSTFNAIGRFTPAEEGVHIRLPDGGTMPLHASGFQHFGGEKVFE